MSAMMGGCKKGGGNCGALDCAWGCCYPQSAAVPTGVVPRLQIGGYDIPLKPHTGPYVYERRAPLPEAEWTGVQPDNVSVGTVDLRTGVFSADKPLAYADPIQQAVDDYLLMERKARAWDELRTEAAKGQLDCCSSTAATLAYMDSFVHPAQEPSKTPNAHS